MKVKVRDCFDSKFNEFIVGPAQTASHGTYLVFGEIEAGSSRRIAPGKGHEEILMVLSGEGILRGPGGEVRVTDGEAVYLDQDFEGELVAAGGGEIRYVSSGGHLPGGHGHSS